VLSKPENGKGGQEYKRVVKTFVHEDKKVCRTEYSFKDTTGRYGENPWYGGSVYSTWDHPFWVEGEGWTAAENLVVDPSPLGHDSSKLRLADESLGAFTEGHSVYRTSQPTVGWVGSPPNTGAEIDFQTLLRVGDKRWYADKDIVESEEPYFKTTVYNIEVEDFHTYYVGKGGVWVHNANCSGVKLRENARNLEAGQAERLRLPPDTKIFLISDLPQTAA
jgi:hypothetical protein